MAHGYFFDSGLVDINREEVIPFPAKNTFIEIPPWGNLPFNQMNRHTKGQSPMT